MIRLRNLIIKSRLSLIFILRYNFHLYQKKIKLYLYTVNSKRSSTKLDVDLNLLSRKLRSLIFSVAHRLLKSC